MYSGNLSKNLPMVIKMVMISDGYVKVGEALYAWVIIWANIVLNHIDTRTILSRPEGFLHDI